MVSGLQASRSRQLYKRGSSNIDKLTIDRQMCRLTSFLKSQLDRKHKKEKITSMGNMVHAMERLQQRNYNCVRAVRFQDHTCLVVALIEIIKFLFEKLKIGGTRQQHFHREEPCVKQGLNFLPLISLCEFRLLPLWSVSGVGIVFVRSFLPTTASHYMRFAQYEREKNAANTTPTHDQELRLAG